MFDRRDLIVAAALLLLTCAVYGASLQAGFYSDDYQWLGRMSPTLERPSYLFTVIYRDFNPVLHASFLVDWIVGGGSASVFHAQSIVVHALNAVLLLLLCRRLGAGRGVAAAAALTWAWNVRLSEAAIWPAARGHALATLFVLATFLVLGSRVRWRDALALGLWVLALLSKETALFVVVLLPFFAGDPRRRWKPYAGFATVAAAFVAFNFLAKPSFHTSEAGAGFLALKIPFILLRPLGLGEQYAFDVASFALVLLALAGVAWLLRRQPTAVLGLCWVAACLVPVVPLDKLSSRYLYLLAVGYALVLCGLIAWLDERFRGAAARRRVRFVGVAVLIPILALNVVRVQREIGDYQLLAAPYAACVEALAPALATLEAGETVTVIEVGPRDAVRRLGDRIRRRGNMSKLIPFRPHGIGGLIALDDLLNVTRERTPGILGYRIGDPAGATRRRYFAYDGERVQEIRPFADDAVDPRVTFHARWGDAVGYFEK